MEELAASLGARWHELHADDPARGITGFAREHQITQIVIGSSQRSRWQELIAGGSIVRRIIQEAGAVGIDVHVIARRELPGGETHDANPAHPAHPATRRRVVTVRADVDHSPRSALAGRSNRSTTGGDNGISR